MGGWTGEMQGCFRAGPMLFRETCSTGYLEVVMRGTTFGASVQPEFRARLCISSTDSPSGVAWETC